MPAANQRESRFVRDQLVRHRPDDHEFVGLLRRHRQVLRDADARDISLDGLELAAIFGVGVGLGIPAIHLADAAAQQQMDNRNITLGGRGGLSAQPQHIAIADEAEQTERADLQECAAIKVVIHSALND